MTIEEDIELAKYWAEGQPQLADGTGQRDVCYRLALEVERLQSRNALLELELTVSAAALAAYDANIDSIRSGIIADNAALCALIADALPFVTDEKWHQIAIKNYAASERIERIETAMKATQNL